MSRIERDRPRSAAQPDAAPSAAGFADSANAQSARSPSPRRGGAPPRAPSRPPSGNPRATLQAMPHEILMNIFTPDYTATPADRQAQHTEIGRQLRVSHAIENAVRDTLRDEPDLARERYLRTLVSLYDAPEDVFAKGVDHLAESGHIAVDLRSIDRTRLPVLQQAVGPDSGHTMRSLHVTMGSGAAYGDQTDLKPLLSSAHIPEIRLSSSASVMFSDGGSMTQMDRLPDLAALLPDTAVTHLQLTGRMEAGGLSLLAACLPQTKLKSIDLSDTRTHNVDSLTGLRTAAKSLGISVKLPPNVPDDDAPAAP